MIRTRRRPSVVERINAYGYRPVAQSRLTSRWRRFWLNRETKAILDGAPGTHAMSDRAPMSRPPR